MLLKLRETKAGLLRMTDNQLDTTTKRTIAENEQMSVELAWQSKETEKLIRKNKQLLQVRARHRRPLQVGGQLRGRRVFSLRKEGRMGGRGERLGVEVNGGERG
eukprot:1830637-Pleurochrysis_carterae.AAC.1